MGASAAPVLACALTRSHWPPKMSYAPRWARQIRKGIVLEFLIKSKSSGSEYMVKAYFDGEHPVLTCSCPAGENGKYCKHRFALIEGDESEVVDASNSAAELAEALNGTALGATIAEMRDHERAVKAAQAELTKIKKRVASQMRGIVR